MKQVDVIVNRTAPSKKPFAQFSDRSIYLLLLIPITIFLISLSIGRYGIPLDTLVKVIAARIGIISFPHASTLDTVIFDLRFPRVIASLIIGAALSIAGAVYQGMFRNPMVSPDILGASAGAGFGAALGILASLTIWQIQVTSFVFGLLAVGLTYAISAAINRENSSTLVLVLTGMVVSTLFQSLISLTKYVADPLSKLPAITFWLMGGLSTVANPDLLQLIVPVFAGIVPLFLIRWQMNVLSFGEEEAQAMGVNTKMLRILIILCSTLITSASVALAGMIGWVGLVIPHMARLISGPNYKTLLPVCLIVGSAYMAIVDDLARNLFAVEIPLGILTAIIGAPFFVYLLLKGKPGWS